MSKLKDLLKSLFPDKAADIDKVELEEIKHPDVSPAAKNSDPAIEELKQLVKTQQAEISKLVTELTAVKEKETANQKMLEEKAKKDKAAAIDQLIKKAIEDLKIPAKNETLIKQYKNLLDKDFDAGKVIIENLTPIGKTAVPPEKDQQGKDQQKNTLGKGDKPILQAILARNEIQPNE